MAKDSKITYGSSPYKEVISWIRPFDGTKKSYSRFASDCDRCFSEIEEKSYKSLINYVLTQLDVEQFPFIYSSSFNTWEDIKTVLDEHFNVRPTLNILFRELTNLTKEPGEEIFRFYNRLIGKCFEYKKLLIKTLDDEQLIQSRLKLAEDYILDSFILSVGMNFRPILMSKKPKTIQEAYSMLRQLEMGSGSTRSDSYEQKLANIERLLLELKGRSNQVNSRQFSNPQVHHVEEYNNDDDDHQVTCQLCDRVGHNARDCFEFNSQRNNNNRQRGFTNQFDHGFNEIQGAHWDYNFMTPNFNQPMIMPPFTRNFNHNRNYSNQHPSNDPRIGTVGIEPDSIKQRPTSYQCKEKVGSEFDSPGYVYDKVDLSSRSTSPQDRQVQVSKNTAKNHYVLIDVDGVWRRALLDSGSQLNLIKRSLLSKHLMFDDHGIRIRGISGCSATYGTILIKFSIGNNWMKDIFHVVDDSVLGNYDFYLGSPFLSDHDCNINYKTLQISNQNFHETINVDYFNYDTRIKTMVDSPDNTEPRISKVIVDPVKRNLINQVPRRYIFTPIIDEKEVCVDEPTTMRAPIELSVVPNDSPNGSTNDLPTVIPRKRSRNHNRSKKRRAKKKRNGIKMTSQYKIGNKVLINEIDNKGSKINSGPFTIEEVLDGYVLIKRNEKVMIVNNRACQILYDDNT